MYITSIGKIIPVNIFATSFRVQSTLVFISTLQNYHPLAPKSGPSNPFFKKCCNTVNWTLEAFRKLFKCYYIDFWKWYGFQYFKMGKISDLLVIRSPHVFVLPSFNHLFVDDTFFPKALHFSVCTFCEEIWNSLFQFSQIFFWFQTGHSIQNLNLSPIKWLVYYSCLKTCDCKDTEKMQ